MREVIQCLIDWLDSMPSDQKAYRVLNSLAKESMKVSSYAKEDMRTFSAKEIVDAEFNDSIEEKPGNPNKWIDWHKCVQKYWEQRESQLIDFLISKIPQPNEAKQQDGVQRLPPPREVELAGYRAVIVD